MFAFVLPSQEKLGGDEKWCNEQFVEWRSFLQASEMLELRGQGLRLKARR